MMTSKNKAIIVASDTKIDLSHYSREGCFIVAIERGALSLIDKKIPIDLAIGDFDKVTKKELKIVKDYAKETLIASAQKDYLDGELAIMELKKRGINRIKFIAESTKRYDKNISICELVWKYDIYFFNDSTTIFRINAGETILDYEKYKDSKYISFFANQPSIVTINDFKYNVKNIDLKPFDNRAISNQFIPNLNGQIETNHDLIVILSR